MLPALLVSPYFLMLDLLCFDVTDSLTHSIHLLISIVVTPILVLVLINNDNGDESVVIVAAAGGPPYYY
jgi:hypothetical protein